MSDTSESTPAVPDTPNVEFLVSNSPRSEGANKDFSLGPPYDPRRQYDWVRLIVTVGLLALFGFVIVWVAIKSSGPDDVWKRTKDMLQIVLPALTALIGSVLGFYFGTQKNNSAGQ